MLHSSLGEEEHSTSPDISLNLPISSALGLHSTVILLFQVLKLTHLPQTLTIHPPHAILHQEFTDRKDLYFPQSLDFNQVLPTEQDLGDAKEQVRCSFPLYINLFRPHSL